MSKALAFVYGIVCYVIFLLTFVWAIGFVTDLVVPKTIDSGLAGPVLISFLVDAVLLGLFAIQHSVMARPAFKSWWTGFVSPAVERSTYVLAASAALLLMFWQWRPLPATVWNVEAAGPRAILWGVCALGWCTVLFGTFMISHTHLFGLRQVMDHVRGRSERTPVFQTRWLYRFIRHPLMLGFLIAFWATPRMTVGHLFFAAMSTGYILVATLAFEERDLERYLGDDYRRYRRQVPAFVPRLGHSVPANRGEESAREATAS